MLKIVLLKSPGNLNVGNEFINVGSEYLVRKSLDRANIGDYKLYCSEFWETALPLYKHQTSWNTAEMRSWINEADLILVSGGAIVNKYMKELLKDIGNMKPPKILLGAGMVLYGEQEHAIAKEALTNYNFVVCRDNILHETIQDSVSSMSGIDSAFFLNDVHNFIQERGKYAVVNIDLGLRQRMRVQKKYRELKKKFEEVYIIENTSILHKNTSGFVFLSRWSEFVNLYRNAAFVSTTRIHTALLCTLFGTTFEYLGSDSEPDARRSSLFHQIGMSLENGKQYSAEELEGYAPTIRQKKEELLTKLTEVCLSLPIGD